MAHPSHNEVLTPEKLAEYQVNAAYVWVYVRFRDEGLTCLEHDGSIGGKPGLEVFNKLLNYFIYEEKYERCAVIRNRIAEYHKEWPQLS